MKSAITKLILALVAMSIVAGAAVAQDATEIMKKSHMAYYYAADDGVADVTMTIVDKKGKERLREFTMIRLDEVDGGNQKYYTYFKKPSDVSRLTFMVHKNPDGNDARWIYVPSVDLIKPISADDKNSSFVGSDFSYEDVSGRHWTLDNHTLKGDSTIDGKAAYVIESIPKEAYKAFARKVSFDVIDGITTVTLRSMQDVKKNRKTTVDFSRITYNRGITADMFSERYLKNPPRKYIK